MDAVLYVEVLLARVSELEDVRKRMENPHYEAKAVAFGVGSNIAPRTVCTATYNDLHHWEKCTYPQGHAGAHSFTEGARA